MIQRFVNLYRLIRILRERGNWPLIRRSRKQLLHFILCRNDMNRKSLPAAACYWFYLLKGLDMLVWRLETFGFLFTPGLSPGAQEKLNRYL